MNGFKRHALLSFMLLIFMAVFVIWSTPEAQAACTGASPTWTSTPDQASVKTCIANASTGDTITLTAGTADWSTGGVTLNKPLTIIGQGQGCPASCDDATTILVGSTTAFAVTASDWRISGITFEGPGNPYGSIHINAGGLSSSVNWRVDHCHFKNTKARGISVGTYASAANYAKDFPGLIDNNRFSATARFKAVQVYGGSATTHGSWDDTLLLGGPSFVFIEDNHFVHTSMVSGVAMNIDGDTGARYVLRYNTFINGDITNHGQEACSNIDADPVCKWKSAHGWEIYRNSFAYTTAHDFVINMRGGTGVIWGNTFSGVDGVFRPVRYLYERGDITRTCLLAGACQGSSPYDGNQSGKYGYMCWQQIGATGSNGITPMPVYQWLNSLNGVTNEEFLTQVTFDAGCKHQHVQIGRDVILLPASASGLSTNRPSSCTTGNGYWATDQGEWNSRNSGPDGQLYKCTAHNTWTLYYTPYTYPHPLRGTGREEPPAAPGSSLRVR